MFTPACCVWWYGMGCRGCITRFFSLSLCSKRYSYKSNCAPINFFIDPTEFGTLFFSLSLSLTHTPTVSFYIPERLKWQFNYTCVCVCIYIKKKSERPLTGSVGHWFLYVPPFWIILTKYYLYIRGHLYKHPKRVSGQTCFRCDLGTVRKRVQDVDNFREACYWTFFIYSLSLSHYLLAFSIWSENKSSEGNLFMVYTFFSSSLLFLWI